METKAFEDFDSMDTQQEEQAKKEKKASAAKVAGIAGAAGIAGGATAFGAEAAIDMINNNIDIEDEIIEEAPTQASGNALKAQKKHLRISTLSLLLSFLGFSIMICFTTLADISLPICLRRSRNCFKPAKG